MKCCLLKAVRGKGGLAVGGRHIIPSLSYDCYASVLRDPESNQRSIHKPAVTAGDPTAAEAASPRTVHNDTHSALPWRVTMYINEFSKR